MLRREAEDVDAVQEREDIGGEDLPDEHARERAPEELQPLVVRGAVEMKSYGGQGEMKELLSWGGEAYFGRWTRWAGSVYDRQGCAYERRDKRSDLHPSRPSR